MLRKIFHAQSKSVTFAALLLGVASLLSRLAGVVRDRLLSGTFGAGAELDSYYAAFRAPDFIYNLFVLGAITAGFIPVFTRFMKPDDTERNDAPAWHLASSLLTIMGTVLVVFSVLGIATAHIFMPWVTPGFTGAQMQITITLTRIMFFSPIFLGLSSVLGGILQTHRRFVVYAFAPIVYNLGIIIGILFLAPSLGAVGVAIGVVLGSFLHFVIQLIACISLGFHYHVSFDFRDHGVRQIGKMMIPRTADLAVDQINLVLLTGMASTLGVGSLAVFNLANNLQSFPVGILGVSFAIAAFPLIAELAAKNKKEEFIRTFSKTVRTILYLIIPATIIFLLLRAQIVRVVLGTGRFDWNDTIATADTLSFFTLSLFAQALTPLIARAFFAFHDVKTPFVIGTIAVVGERLLARVFIGFGMGTSGLALAFSLGTILNAAALWVFLRLRTGHLEVKRIARSLGLMTIAATGMVVSMQGSKILLSHMVNMQTFMGILTQGAVAGTVGIAVYVGITFLVGSEEAADVMKLYRRKFAAIPPETVHQEDDTLQGE